MHDVRGLLREVTGSLSFSLSARQLPGGTSPRRFAHGTGPSQLALVHDAPEVMLLLAETAPMFHAGVRNRVSSPRPLDSFRVSVYLATEVIGQLGHNPTTASVPTLAYSLVFDDAWTRRRTGYRPYCVLPLWFVTCERRIPANLNTSCTSPDHMLFAQFQHGCGHTMSVPLAVHPPWACA